MISAIAQALMCWPTGWTGFASVAMAWCHWLQRMRCELWRLNCWPNVHTRDLRKAVVGAALGIAMVEPALVVKATEVGVTFVQPTLTTQGSEIKRLYPYWLWLVMSLPAVAMFFDYATTTAQRPLRALLGPSGEWATYFLLIALAATPLVLMLPGWRGPRWLVRNRRYFGVAAFFYSAVHLGAYLGRGSDLATLLEQAMKFDLATGWVAFLIMVPLAVTSSELAVRKMGRGWKTLQRWVYPAAVLTLLHWASVEDWRNAGLAIAFFLPLAALTAYRGWWNLLRVRPTPTS